MSEEGVGRRRLFSWAAVTSLAGLVWSRAAWADSKSSNSDSEGLGTKVAGTYLLTVLHEGFPPALALVTLTRDGGFLANDTSDQGALGLTHDGLVQGSWKKIGPRRIKARTLYFAFEPGGSGIPQWIARSTGEFEFDKTFTSGSGALTVERFDLSQDPLDPNEVPSDPAGPLQATLTARRVTVD